MITFIKKNPTKLVGLLIVQLLVFALLFLIKNYNYNLFHSFVECYSIAVALGVFFIVINSKKHVDNAFLKLLSTGYLFMIFIDFLHMLSYKGMYIFSGYDTNLPTQLWIFSRYIESLTLLMAIILMNYKINTKGVYGVYAFITGIGLFSIFTKHFPDAYIEGIGLTSFKIVSEYIIIAIFGLALFLLYKNKDKFDKSILKNLYLYFAFAILTDLMFTFYSDPFDIFNLLGHYFKIISVYFIYKAVIKVAVKDPQSIIFREIALKKKELEQEVKDNIIELESLNRSKATLIESMQDLVLVLDHNLVFIELYSRDSNLLYVEPGDFLNKHFDDISLPEPAHGKIKQTLEETLKSGKPGRVEYFLDMPEGRLWFDNQVTLIPGDEGENAKILCIVRDITSRVEMEEIIFNEKEQFKTTLLSIGDGVISTDKEKNVLVINHVAEILTGWSQEEAYGKPLSEVFHIINEFTREPCENPAQKVLETGDIIELANHTLLISKTGKEIPIEDCAAPIKNSHGETTGIVLVFRDFTEKKEKQKEIEFLSYHDYLTGLYNRRYIEEVLKQLDSENNLPLAVMILDVNGLKLTNDAFGHQMGNKLLQAVAKVLTDVCRPQDIIGRYGGDEFAILLPRTDATQAEDLLEQILNTTSKIALDSVVVSLAGGYAVKTNINQDLGTIRTIADNNMYKNKLRNGKTMRSRTIETVLRHINLKYDQEQIHTERVSQYCEMIARAMGLRKKEIIDIKTAGSLHDIGKITLPSELLNKPGKLTSEEYEIIKRHSETGYQMLKSVDEYVSLAESVLHHHERWDGKGYPSGLKGENIPLESRIIAVADVFEAMTAKRPYQPTKSREEAIAELIRCSGTQFDPHIVQLFVNALEAEKNPPVNH